jgi:MFS family permease
MLAALLFGRGMDILSTWVATPNLELEGNPIAKLLGWRWGLPVNFLFCVALAFWPLPAIILTTTSLLVAARNFQSAWLMRTMGEEAYREWHIQRIRETRITLYLGCLAGNTLLTAAVGAAVVYFSERTLLLFGIGVGIVAYGGAVAFYTLLAIFRLRRSELRNEQRRLRKSAGFNAPAADQPLTKVYFPEEAQGK